MFRPVEFSSSPWRKHARWSLVPWYCCLILWLQGCLGSLLQVELRSVSGPWLYCLPPFTTGINLSFVSSSIPSSDNPCVFRQQAKISAIFRWKLVTKCNSCSIIRFCHLPESELQRKKSTAINLPPGPCLLLVGTSFYKEWLDNVHCLLLPLTWK